MTIKQYYFIPVFSKYKQVKDILGNHCSTFVLITVRYMGLHIKILHKDKEHRSSSTPNKQQNLEHDDFSVELNNTLTQIAKMNTFPVDTEDLQMKK